MKAIQAFCAVQIFGVGARIEAEWTPSKPSKWAPATVQSFDQEKQQYQIVFDALPDNPRVLPTMAQYLVAICALDLNAQWCCRFETRNL
jgi:hypothetical protein